MWDCRQSLTRWLFIHFPTGETKKKSLTTFLKPYLIKDHRPNRLHVKGSVMEMTCWCRRQKLVGVLLLRYVTPLAIRTVWSIRKSSVCQGKALYSGSELTWKAQSYRPIYISPLMEKQLIPYRFFCSKVCFSLSAVKLF